SDEKIPTLDETVQTALKNGSRAYLELKTNPNENQLRTILDIVEKHGMAPRTTWLIWDTSPGILKKMNDLARTDSAMAMLTHEMTEESISQALTLKKKSGREFWISAKYNTVTEGLIGLAHEEGLKVNVWTVNDNSTAFRFYKWGADSITTDGIVNLKNYMEAIGYTPEEASQEQDTENPGNSALPAADQDRSADAGILADDESCSLTQPDNAAADITKASDMIEAAGPSLSEDCSAAPDTQTETEDIEASSAKEPQENAPTADAAVTQKAAPDPDSDAAQDTTPIIYDAEQQETVPAVNADAADDSAPQVES
ncbi:MAG: hypothetical protein IKF16_04525, partial [Lachnospiraceae bacterium]|nr:hypothetical protein [Lachnospiraceae bacterium]